MFLNARSKRAFMGLFGLLTGIVFLFSVAPSYSANIAEINSVIRSTGGKWFAKETPLSHLSLEEMRGWTGALEPATPYEGANVNQSLSVPGSSPLPSSFDWTNHNGKNYVTGIRNQGGCGSCWAFAATAALESKSLITFNMPNQDLNLSEQIVLSCTGTGDSCAGGYMEDAANFIKNSGTGPESCYPYTATNGSCGQACANLEISGYRISNWSYVVQWTYADVNTIKSAISQYGPLPIFMVVYQDFQSYGSGVYTRTSNVSVGNHFVLAVGWDDNAGGPGVGAFRIKNSWGTSWGESGYCRIAYSEVYTNSNSKTQLGRGTFAFGNAVYGGRNLVNFDGDGKSDIAYYRESNATWNILPSSGAQPYQVHWGGDPSDTPVPGDYDGDGKTDIAVYRESMGWWIIVPSSNISAPYLVGWGSPGDIPVPGDYDGDGKTDIAVYRPSNGWWIIILSSNPGAPYLVGWGSSGDIPVPSDYDGDGKTDIAVYRPSNGWWIVIPSSNPGAPYLVGWGTAADIPVPGDYDGDGKTDIAVYRPSNGWWIVIPSSNPGAPYLVGWGTAADIPVPGDYDGDGKTDIAVYRPSHGWWVIIPSSNPSAPYLMVWGGDSSDIPLTLP